MLRIVVLALVVSPAGTALATETGQGATPVPIEKISPDFPSDAERAGIQGLTSVELSVDAEGRVGETRLLREEPQGYGFAKAAIRAVRKWRFEPDKPGTYEATVSFAYPGIISIADYEALPPAPVAKPIAAVASDKAAASGKDGVADVAVTIDALGRITAMDLVNALPVNYYIDVAAFVAVHRAEFLLNRPGRYRVRVYIRNTDRAEPPLRLPPDVRASAAEPPQLPPPAGAQPTYPRAAEKNGVQGDATLEISVGADGYVVDARILQEKPDGYDFGLLAQANVMTWQFKSAAPGRYLVTIKYVLR